MNASTTNNLLKKHSNRSFSYYFLAISLSIILGLSIFLWFMFSSAKLEVLNYNRANETNKVNLGTSSIRKELTANRSDLLFLSDLLELKSLLETSQYLDKNDQDFTYLLSREYFMFTMRKGLYDQIRLINPQGYEVLRINYNGGQPTIVPNEQLQYKGDRYYFTQTIHLNKGEIFISPFDLNIENNQIEQPIKPTIRFGTPVFDSANTMKGILIVNYLGSQLINNFTSVSADDDGTPALLNSDGYWLSGDNPDDEWGFMFDDKKNRNYQTMYPNAWQVIENGTSGQFITNEGLFTYTTISPFVTSAAYNSNDQNYVWKVVSRLSPEMLAASEKTVVERYILIWIVLVIGVFLFSYFYTRNVMRKNELSNQLRNLATHDKLTGLPNRALFLDRLQQALSETNRYKYKVAVFFLDLDGFKKINDSYGHDIGDLLLVEVAARMKKSVRESDTVARMGGDEFTIILSRLNSSEEAAAMAVRLINEISLPVHLASHICSVGVSIGIGMYPEDGTDVEILLQKADSAMYKVKQNSKNNYCLAKNSA